MNTQTENIIDAQDQAEERIRVVFKKFKGDIIALFPEIEESRDGKFIGSYMHIGQHSGASRDLLKCRNAKPEDYKDLAQELRGIGYIF